MKKLPTYAAVLATACMANHQARANSILGIDVSGNQGSINWTSVHGDGVVWAYAKATEGNYYEDSDYVANMSNGKSAGVQMGAYHFARPGLDTPATEANYFWSFAGGHLKADGKSLSPAIDFEDFSGHVGTATYTAWFNNWAADVEAKTTNSMAPVIYTSCTGACDLGSSITLGFWLPAPGLTSCTCDPVGDVVVYLQEGTGSISGISGSVDLDAYNGTLAQLKVEEGIGGK